METGTGTGTGLSEVIPVYTYSFKILYNCGFGNAIYLVGSDEALGNWNVMRAIRLVNYREDCWIKTIELKKKEYEYKYFIANYEDIESESIRWINEDNLYLGAQDIEDYADVNKKEIKLMSFNLRYENTIDVSNSWDNRKKTAIQVITSYLPDLLCIQEGRLTQVSYLKSSLELHGSCYDYYGQSRGPNYDDEHCGIFYNRNKFILTDSGQFWLSDTPSIYSITFGNYYPRIATWVKLNKTVDLTNAIDRTFFIFNTHFDNVSKASRVKSTEVLLNEMNSIVSRSRNSDIVIFITGDFNSDETEETYSLITSSGFTSCSNYKENMEKTFHGFSGIGIIKIDFIYYKQINGTMTDMCSDYQVIKDMGEEKNGCIYPSDHFPILGTFSL